jgi:hypothetical protein
MEQMYKMALDPRIFPDSRLLAVLQGKDSSLPMAVAMSAKQQRDKLEAASRGQQAQMGAKQPTVRDQMLAKDLPQPQAGLDQLPAPTMENMGSPAMGAAGGLVSFAQGGFTDPDEDEQQTDQEELDALMARQGDLGGLGAGIMAVANPKATPYSSVGMQDKGISSAPGNLKDVLAVAAEKHKVPTDLLNKISYAESGHKLNSSNKLSSAKGLFGFTNSSWKGMGGTEENRFDPETNADLGARLIRQNAEGLKKAFGRDPTYGEVYASHYFGLGGAKSLFNKNPNTPMVKAVSPEVIKANPNLKDKNVGQVMSILNKKMGDGVVTLAGGGIVSLAKGGDYTSFGEENPYDPNEPSIGDTIGNMLGSPLERLRNSMLGVGAKSKKEIATELATAKETKNKPPVVTPAPAAPTEPVVPVTNKNQNAPIVEDPMQKALLAPPDKSQQAIADYYQQLAQSRKQAPGLALMAAGLGIAGQRSPYGLSNVGVGGLQGLQQYAQSQKEDQTGQIAGLSAQAAMDRNKIYQQHYDTAAQAGLDAKYSAQVQDINSKVQKEIDANAIMKNNATQAEQYRQRRFREMLQSNPKLVEWYKSQGGDLGPTSIQVDTVPGNVIGSVKPK